MGGLQAEFAYEPAVSADGRYVAFTGVIASWAGVWRKDISTPNGPLELVAEGVGAGAPAISADGQYVSFTSFDEPATGTPNADGCTQVWVRNMGVPSPGERGAFEIVSARTGSREPLVYEGSGKVGKNKETGREEKCPGGGSASAARAAISENGREVAFTVLGKSNLTAEQSNPHATVTPPDQVAVRELGATPEASIPAGATPEEPTTTLVSVTRGEQPVPGGAALSGRPEIQQEPLRHGEGTTELSNVDASTAAISADGNAVAWMGVNIFDQVPTNGGKIETIEKEIEGGHTYVDDYAEPLWREISPKRETRRPLAGDDASAPGCPPSCAGGLDLEWDEQATAESQELVGPQYGSDVAGWKTGFLKVETVTPQLSKDGQEVAIISTQPNYGHLPEFGSFEADREKQPDANAFVVNMASGLSRAQAITRLTEWGSIDFENRALDGAIDQIAISSDGTRVAFTTERSVFALAPPALITAPVSQEEPAQLYEANLKAGTLALVSEGYNGEPANLERGESGASEPALSADGGVVALTSGSSNLAFGTINQGRAVFVTREDDSPDEPGRQSVTALPPGPAGEREWSISATAVPTSGGALLIDVSVPGAGRLAASASAPVPTTVTVANRSGKRSTRRGARRRSLIATRQVAHAATATGEEGLVQLRLLPSSHYRPLADGKDGLYATIEVTFAAAGHRKLTVKLQAGFPRPARHRTARPSSHPTRRKPPAQKGRR